MITRNEILLEPSAVHNLFSFLFRSQMCTHLQCFDASIYLQMNERSVPFSFSSGDIHPKKRALSLIE